jgi:hypothetical protein
MRGKSFELKVAAILRRKLGAKVSRDRRSGAGINKSDISDYYHDIPLHLELKDQATIKIKEWFRQAEGSASFNRAPTVVFAVDEEVLACIRLSDLVNFMVEIADQKAEITDLRAPVTTTTQPDMLPKSIEPILDAMDRGSRTCRDGHLSDAYGYCMQKTCKYNRAYKKPKGKK